MTSLRRCELALGIVAGIVGLVTTGIAFFAPIRFVAGACLSGVRCTVAAFPRYSLFQTPLFSWGELVAFTLIAVGLLLFTWLHGARRVVGSLLCLFVLTLVLCVAIVPNVSVGVYYLPTALLAFLVCMCGSLAALRGAPTASAR